MVTEYLLAKSHSTRQTRVANKSGEKRSLRHLTNALFETLGMVQAQAPIDMARITEKQVIDAKASGKKSPEKSVQNCCANDGPVSPTKLAPNRGMNIR